MDIAYGYCGMPCALCTRYRTEGKSRCPGCSCDGYYTDVCKVHHCCREKGLNHCGQCPGFPCVRLNKMSDFRDLNTGHVKQRTCAFIAEHGFDAWYRDYAQRAELLSKALQNYNDGRMKRFLCELFLQRELGTLREMIRRAENITETPKEAGKAFRALVQTMDREAELSEELKVHLRTFQDDDMERFKRWLQMPYVAKWYHEPEDWLREIADRNGEYGWIHHFIAERDGEPVGFCQYYAYTLGGEAWHGSIDTDGAYSIDYLIGEAAYLGKGLGRQIVLGLMDEIRRQDGANRIIVQPDPENFASCGLLRACGFVLDAENEVYIYELCGPQKERDRI